MHVVSTAAMATITRPCRRAAASCLQQAKLLPKGNTTSTTTTTPSVLLTSSWRSLSSSSSSTTAIPLRRSQQPLSQNNKKTRLSSPSSLRTYHSYDHPPSSPSNQSFSPTERQILTAAYAHVPKHGFSQTALALGARDAGYLDISTNLLPSGVFSLIQWHLVSQREALAGRARELFGSEGGQQQERERLGVGRKVEILTWERLMGNREVIRRWQEALAIMAQPSYIPTSLQELAKLADEIWFLVGDTAVDPSWYTKRASLSTIYASTELFMTTDTSEDFIETRKFLRRRLAEVHEVGGTLRSVGQWVGFTANAGLNVLRSKGMPI